MARWNERHPGVNRAALRKRRAENPWYRSLFGSGDGPEIMDWNITLQQNGPIATYTWRMFFNWHSVYYCRKKCCDGKVAYAHIRRQLIGCNPLKGYTPG